MNLDHFGISTMALAGPLEAKLQAVRAAGFTQVTLSAAEITGHPGGEEAAIAALRSSGLRVCAFEALRDFEGLPGHLHDSKVGVAKAMLGKCRALGCKLLVAWSSTSSHASGDAEAIVRDLRSLAMLAVPYGIRIGYEPLSWGRHVDTLSRAADIVDDADRANLGLVVDSFHTIASGAKLAELEYMDAGKIFLVQLSDFLTQDVQSAEERRDIARHSRVFPGEGTHGAELTELVRRLDDAGYRGDLSFEVYNDDYLDLPRAAVAIRARDAAKWVTDRVSRRSLPIRRPGRNAAL